MINILIAAIFILVISGCSKVETDPDELLPVLKIAQRCCDNQSKCVFPLYDGVSSSVACEDVYQLERCVSGNREQCPLKGYGAF